jgi:methenyltetrahydrofolate cyclohydrolase
MLKDLNVENFVNELSSNSPAPGGGSAAALSASLAAALTSMVYNLTVGKKAYMEMTEEYKRLIDNSLKESNLLKEKFLKIMERDAEVFLEVMAIYKLPKETEEEKAIRNEKIKQGYAEAMKIPFELAQITLELYEYIQIAAVHGNKNAVSDAGVAALLNQAALEGAVLNVKINLSAIEDEEIKEEKLLECTRMTDEGNHKKSEILNIVNSRL